MFICYNIIIDTVNGDISFGSNIIRPTFEFVGTLLPPSPPVRILTFDVIRDDILEGQEIGLLTIAPSTSLWFSPKISQCENYYHRLK